jgi:transcription antitermination factor NusG
LALSGASIARLRRDIDEAGGVVIVEKGRCRWKERREPPPTPMFEVNQPIRVTDGKFSGFSGLYLATTAEARIKILLDEARLAPVIDIPEAWVSPA